MVTHIIAYESTDSFSVFCLRLMFYTYWQDVARLQKYERKRKKKACWNYWTYLHSNIWHEDAKDIYIYSIQLEHTYRLPPLVKPGGGIVHVWGKNPFQLNFHLHFSRTF